MGKRILVADDDPNICDVVQFALEKAGMAVHVVHDGAAAIKAAGSFGPDLIVLDINMPEQDGLDVCRGLRKTSDVPIIFLSSRDEEFDRIIGLEIGADDYVTKPFSPRELVARINTVLKRITRPAMPQQADSPAIINHGRLTIDTGCFTANYDGTAVELTATEFKLLCTVARCPAKVFDRAALLNGAYDHNVNVSDRTIDSHIRHIRKKLAEAGCENIIETVRGVGYRICPCH